MSSHDSAIEYLATAKIGEKGQLTVPKEFRDDLGLGAGSPFTVLRMGDALLLLPQQQRFERLCREVTDTLARAGITAETALATLPEVRKRLFTRRYGTKSAKKSNRRV